MRGSVHVCGSCEQLDATFESNPPVSNPPKAVYYRRAVYMLALERLRSIVEAIEGADTHRTGKVYRDAHGAAIGRGKGIMPSLAKAFPEIRYWTAGPAELRKVIRQAKTPAYFNLLQATIHQVEGTSGEQLELFVKSAPRAELDEIPPVLYPAHQGKKSCRHCQRPHSSALHRFHLPGAFDRTHPGPERAEVRKQQRTEDTERWKDEIPF